MLEVTVYRTVTSPQFQIFQQEVRLYGFDKLTPRAARAALQIAFGNDRGGSVWGGDYGYIVYPKSTRKFYADVPDYEYGKEDEQS